MSEVLTFIACVGGLIVGVLAFMVLMNYAIANHIPVGMSQRGFPGGSLSTKEAMEDAIQRQRAWTRKGIVGFLWTLAIGAPFVILAEIFK
jgi:hypothetical protein